MKGEMATRYEPAGVEERWQKTWEAEGLYNADPDPSRESFAIAHPPPNVTGDLHLGHALQLSLADTIVRTRRMQGYNVLFQPGFDHAGISTQNAVEKHLATQGKTRQDLGREKFEALVWEWLREYGGTTLATFRRICTSPGYRHSSISIAVALAGPRSPGLRERPRPRPARADRDRSRRADERGGRRSRWACASRGGRADPRVARGARPAREARVVPAHGHGVRSLQVADRA